MGTPAEHWYYAGRDHLFFADEADIHHGEPRPWRCPRSRPGCASDSPVRELGLDGQSLIEQTNAAT